MTGFEREQVDWSGAAPRSARFDDIYFSPQDGLAEARAVFLQGCGLPERWSGRSRFTVGELGFGTGLNILALLELWTRTRGAGAQLHVFSVEAFPLTREDAARALASWPELAFAADPLLRAWPDGRAGFHRVELPQAAAVLDLFIGEAAAGLQAWTGLADAWFLDGFAPARNPQMWREAVLAALAPRSAPGARVATFTVAGAVRRGLAAAGFEVAKRPGYARKRERLEGWLRAAPAAGRLLSTRAALPRVAILGAGIAGASLARAFSRLGATPEVFEAERPGHGASGNPAALVTPRLDAGLNAVSRLHAHAFARAVELYRAETPDAVLAEGALQLAASPRDGGRFDRLAGWNGFAPGAVSPLDGATAAARLDEPEAPRSLELRDALTLEPAKVLATWLGQARLHRTEVAQAAPSARGWRLLDPSGDLVAEADIVCVALGAQAPRLVPAPLRPVRGQLAWTATRFRGQAAAWGGYAIPTRGGGTLFGATHDREDSSVDPRAADTARNLESLARGRPALAARVEGSLASHPLEVRAAIRAATPDHLPLAGAAPGAGEGVFVLAGLGGRGFSLAPLLAEHVAALALGAPSPISAEAAAAIDPARFGPRPNGGP